MTCAWTDWITFPKEISFVVSPNHSSLTWFQIPVMVAILERLEYLSLTISDKSLYRLHHYQLPMLSFQGVY